MEIALIIVLAFSAIVLTIKNWQKDKDITRLKSDNNLFLKEIRSWEEIVAQYEDTITQVESDIAEAKKVIDVYKEYCLTGAQALKVTDEDRMNLRRILTDMLKELSKYVELYKLQARHTTETKRDNLSETSEKIQSWAKSLDCEIKHKPEQNEFFEAQSKDDN